MEGPGKTPLKTRTGRTLPPSAILPGASVNSCSRVKVNTQVLGPEEGSEHPTPHCSPGTDKKFLIRFGIEAQKKL